ncbi:MAG: hypothetical protein OR994_07725 [Candidatus Poseidoniales archaeon]|nr:hypothetical protein [Candidatus Poseidoniales archaeon]
MKEKKDFDGWENIDWEVEIDTLEFDLMAINSHNKNNPNVGNEWKIWPKEMTGIILLPLGYNPPTWQTSPVLDPDEESSLKKGWLKLAQFIDENDSISLQENTFTIDGKYGSEFSFDISMELSMWLPPNSLNRYENSIRAIRNGAPGRGNLGTHMGYLEASIASWKICINLEDDGLGFHDFPPHVKGLELKQYEGWSTFVNPSGDTFPESLLILIELLIADNNIWEILHQQELDRRKANEEWNKKWPNGRPDDWMYL